MIHSGYVAFVKLNCIKLYVRMWMCVCIHMYYNKQLNIKVCMYIDRI